MKKILLIFSLVFISNANAQFTLDLPDEGLTLEGGSFIAVNEVGEFVGTLNSITFNTTLTASTEDTYCNDFTIFVTATSDLNSEGLLQVGGYSDFGALEYFELEDGASEEVGTTCSETYTLSTPIVFTSSSTYTIWVANGYYPEEVNSGTWTGAITLGDLSLQNLSTNDFSATKLLVYPNPSKDIVNISNSLNTVVNTIEIADLNGRIVKSQNINANNGQVSISDLSSGVYMMKITSDKGTATKKIIKN